MLHASTLLRLFTHEPLDLLRGSVNFSSSAIYSDTAGKIWNSSRFKIVHDCFVFLLRFFIIHITPTSHSTLPKLTSSKQRCKITNQYQSRCKKKKKERTQIPCPASFDRAVSTVEAEREVSLLGGPRARHRQ
jgi:hypothetical protein